MICAAASPEPADARRRHVVHHFRKAAAFDARYAAIVVDANSGAVLHAANPDALRHPASLTKIMTLYLLFERLEAGKVRLDSEFKVTAHAAGQSPTKLGLREGSTIEVEDAIKGIVTRSANDAAVVIAENLAGDEEEFAALMTKKAHALGMSRTVYRNASGLPNDEQVTTARDQAILARAIQERFPRYYKFFSTRAFVFRGQTIGNHNHLLGSVDGVDGIKTGYTHASGYNLVTSLHRGGHYVVAVVLGGPSAGSRDARMRSLLAEYVDQASTRRTAPMVAEANVDQKPERSSKPAAQGYMLASADSTAVQLPPESAPARHAAADNHPPAVAGATEPIRPVLVKTVTVQSGRTIGVWKPSSTEAAPARVASAMPAPPARAGLLGYLPVHSNTGSLAEQRPAPTRTASVAPTPIPTPAATAAAAPAKVHTGWIIQVGAYTAEGDAKEQLNTVQSKAGRLLGSAEPFTESISKGGTVYYRARFAGLGQDQAEAACKYLKRNSIDCVTVKN